MALDVLAKQFEDFLEEAHRLKAEYSSQIALLVGLETEFITRPDLDYLDALLARLGPRVEYVVGSIHHVNAIPIDFDLPTFDKALQSVASDMERFLCAYFDSQYELLQRFHPEIVGHFDLCRLYNPGLRFADYPHAHEKMEKNIKYAVEYGALFEASAAAFKKHWDTGYPGKDVVEVILKYRGRFALSDDSHGPQGVGQNYERLAEYLCGVGVSEVWCLERKAGARRLQPRKVDRADPFWSKVG